MAELAHLIIAGPDLMTRHGGAVLLEVLEAAQRLVAYCDNDSVGGTEDAELAGFGLPTVKLDRALRDLRRAVQEMNRAMATEEGCEMLASLSLPVARRLV